MPLVVGWLVAVDRDGVTVLLDNLLAPLALFKRTGLILTGLTLQRTFIAERGHLRLARDRRIISFRLARVAAANPPVPVVSDTCHLLPRATR
jgi:hypothetical protein